VPASQPGNVTRHDRLGGLIHEYRAAAYLGRDAPPRQHLAPLDAPSIARDQVAQPDRATAAQQRGPAARDRAESRRGQPPARRRAVGQADQAQPAARREQSPRLGQKRMSVVGREQVEDVGRDEPVELAVWARQLERGRLEHLDTGARPPRSQALPGEANHHRAHVDAEVAGIARKTLAQKASGVPARPAAELEHRPGRVEAAQLGEARRRGVLVEALRVLCPPDAVVDPARVLRGERHR
jgi:hypothetical protein